MLKVGALIIAYTILVVPYYKLYYHIPQNPNPNY